MFGFFNFPGYLVNHKANALVVESIIWILVLPELVDVLLQVAEMVVLLTILDHDDQAFASARVLESGQLFLELVEAIGELL